VYGEGVHGGEWGGGGACICVKYGGERKIACLAR
jgi:hypothetical protein